MTRVDRWSLLRDVVLAGGLAGALAGVLMGALAAGLLSIFPPHDPWAAARWLGEGLSRGSVGPTAALGLGIVVHLGVAGGLGTTFALLLPRGGTGVAALAWGILFGLVLVPVMIWLVASWTAPVLYSHMEPGVVLVLHVLFGAALGSVAPLRRLLVAVQRPFGAATG